MAQIDTKVALVTGSSSGIGEATVKLLCKNGYKVVVCGSNKNKVDRVVNECSVLSPHKPLGLVLNFANPDNGEVAVKKTLEHFGRLDVLVNNAGIILKTSPNDTNSYEDYKKIFDINTNSTVRSTLAAVEHLKKTNGHLIFVSSVVSTRVHQDSYAYCMSKAAMTMFAKCLAVDLAPNVRVNIVSPGPIMTEVMQRAGIGATDPELVAQMMKTITLQERIGRSEEVASVIYFLITDGGSFINGHDLYVDGGYSLKIQVPPMLTTKKA